MKKTRIQEVMRQRGFTQDMLGNALGITKQAVNAAISAPNPKLSTLESIARVLGVPTYELFVDPAELEQSDGPSVAIACPHCGAPLEAVLPVVVRGRTDAATPSETTII